MTLNIDKEYLGELGFDYEKIAKEVVEAALDFEKCPYEAEVSLVLTTDEEIRKTNAEFRKIDRVTDVLSFPMLDFDTPGDFSFLEEEEDAFHPDTGELILGDITHRRLFRRYCSRNLSVINAINSELVGLPFAVLTVYPKKVFNVSKSPRSHAISMAWRIARSTRDEVVSKCFATAG